MSYFKLNTFHNCQICQNMPTNSTTLLNVAKQPSKIINFSLKATITPKLMRSNVCPAVFFKIFFIVNKFYDK